MKLIKKLSIAVAFLGSLVTPVLTFADSISGKSNTTGSFFHGPKPIIPELPITGWPVKDLPIGVPGFFLPSTGEELGQFIMFFGLLFLVVATILRRKKA
ncbi:MAG: LPXTG cell wall anchor domain-containing protein [Lactobacillales bacterium]|jgi:LPXTG-motif cell wall-anchored protein|nr:LPXTG cell wall anchor domain-containing protein [Lactobacillales bacterium]